MQVFLDGSQYPTVWAYVDIEQQARIIQIYQLVWQATKYARLKVMQTTNQVEGPDAWIGFTGATNSKHGKIEVWDWTFESLKSNVDQSKILEQSQAHISRLPASWHGLSVLR